MKKKKSKEQKEKVAAQQTSDSQVESRRSFISKLWKGLAVLAGIEFTAVIFGFLFSSRESKDKSKPKQLVEAGPINSFPKNSVTPFRGGRFYLTRFEDGGLIALSLRCTHLGCAIEWEEEKKRFICPCHSSAFSMNGEVQNPPAPKALDYYPIIIEDGIIKVDVGTKIERARFSNDQIVYI